VSLFDRQGNPVRGFAAPAECDGNGAKDYLWEFLCRHDGAGGHYAMYSFTGQGEPGSLATMVMSKREFHYLVCPIVAVQGGGYGLGEWKVTSQVSPAAEAEAN
jgi:hypothetical protein